MGLERSNGSMSFSFFLNIIRSAQRRADATVKDIWTQRLLAKQVINPIQTQAFLFLGGGGQNRPLPPVWIGLKEELLPFSNKNYR